MTVSRRLDDAYRDAQTRGMFTGPAWTVLLLPETGPGAPLVPFEVRARTPHLAQIAAAAVLRSPDWSVIGVIPGHHHPVPGSRIVPAHQLAAEHPELHTAALEVADANLAAIRERGAQPAAVSAPAAAASHRREPHPARTR